MVSKDDIIELMRCPDCKGELDNNLTCKNCKKRWKSDEGIPLMMDKL